VWLVAQRKISDQAGFDALQAWRSGEENPETVAVAVRYSLQLLKARAPGQSVEVRVPPYGAVQVIEGSTHTRGTPPAVVEVGPTVWLEMVVGLREFSEAIATGTIRASGARSDLSAWLPIVSLP